MLERNSTLRAATRNDAAHLARLIDIAGEGLPFYFWQRAAADGEDPWAFGRRRAERDAGAFSWRNATIAETGSEIAAALVTYVIDPPAPVPDYADLPPMFVPLQQLEDMAGGTQYIHVLAAYPQSRGRGLGTRLLGEAERIAGGRPMSLIAADNNTNAIRLYERVGYRRHAARPMVKEDWQSDGENWILMLK